MICSLHPIFAVHPERSWNKVNIEMDIVLLISQDCPVDGYILYSYVHASILLSFQTTIICKSRCIVLVGSRVHPIVHWSVLSYISLSEALFTP